MIIYHNPRFRFKGGNGFHGTCDVKLYEREDGQRTVVVSELVQPDGSYANRGVSVTNGIEYVLARFYNETGQQWDQAIEFTPRRGVNQRHGRDVDSLFVEDFSVLHFKRVDRDSRWSQAGQVDFKVDGDTHPWKHLSRTEAEAIIGEPHQYEYVDEVLHGGIDP